MKNICAVYQRGEKVAEIDINKIPYWRAKSDIFVWISISELNLEGLSLLQKEFDLHDLAIEDVVSNHQRPKIERYGDVVFVVIQTLNTVKEKLKKRQLSIFVGSNFLISIGRVPYSDFVNTFSLHGGGSRFSGRTPSSILYGLIDAVSDQYLPIISEYENQIDGMESCIFDCEKSEENIKRLYTIKRGVLELGQAINPFVEITAKLYSARILEVPEELRNYFRDVHDHLIRMAHSTEVLRETIGSAIQANLTAVTIEESKVTKKLAAWAAIFGVGTLMVGIWGMNFKFMPELTMKYGYPLALIFIIICSGSMYARFRKMRWI